MKKIAVIVLLAAMLLLVLAGCQSAKAIYTGTGETETVARIRIVTMDGEKLYDGKVKVIDDGPTVYMALHAAAEDKDLRLDIMGDGEGMFLNGINDLMGADPNYWMYYINRELAMNGIAVQAVNEGDVVEFIYGDYNEGYVEVK